MARIPAGQDFGGVIAAPPPQYRRASPEEFGAGVGGAIAQAGQVVTGIGLSELNRIGVENQRLFAQQETEQKAQADAADKAIALATLGKGKNDLGALHDQIAGGVLDGTVDKNKAASIYQEQSGKLVDQVGQSLDDTSRGIVVAELGNHAGTLGLTLQKTVDQRNQQDVAGGMDQTLEYLQRQYQTNPAAAKQQAEATIASLGPFSGRNPEQLAKIKQKWNEDAQFATGYSAVSAGRDNYQALDAAAKTLDKLTDLDPTKKAELLNRVDMYRSRLDAQREAAANKAERLWEHQLKVAEATTKVISDLADKGTFLDPATIDQALATTAGTPYQREVVQLAQMAAAGAGMAALPIKQQQAQVDATVATIATQGRSEALDKRLAVQQKIVAGTKAAIAEDGIVAWSKHTNDAVIAPLDLSGGIDGMMKSFGERVQQANQASTWAGHPVSPLTSDDADAVRKLMDALPAKQKAGAIAAMAAATGPQQASAIALQLNDKDKPLSLAFGYAGIQTSKGRYTSELILSGAQAIKDGTAAKDPAKLTGWTAKIAGELQDVYPVATMNDAAKSAAGYIVAAIAAENSGIASNSDITTAVNLAVGGKVIEHNDRNIPLPPNMEAGDLEKRLKSVSAAELANQAPGGNVRAAGVLVSVGDFVKSLPGAQLIYAGQGRYNVLAGGRPVTDETGKQRISIKVQ